MEQTIYIEEKKFDKINFTVIPLTRGEYERCVFISCNFLNADLSEIKFIECEFIDCDLSLSKLKMTTFNDVKYKNCKMLGLLFYNCNGFGFAVKFDCCNLSHSSFYQRKIKKTYFINSRLNEVDFTESDLTSSVFDKCDLTNAKFENTVIEKADFLTSFNYSIDPSLNRIKKAKFSLSGVIGLLDRYDIEIE
jgi:fluoroquinolone resistance protein